MYSCTPLLHYPKCGQPLASRASLAGPPYPSRSAHTVSSSLSSRALEERILLWYLPIHGTYLLCKMDLATGELNNSPPPQSPSLALPLSPVFPAHTLILPLHSPFRLSGMTRTGLSGHFCACSWLAHASASAPGAHHPSERNAT
jgi:hypothetical protein